MIVKKKFLNFLMIFSMGNLMNVLINPAQANREWKIEVSPTHHTLHASPAIGMDERYKGYSQIYGGTLPKAPLFQTYLPDSHSHFEAEVPLFMSLPSAYFSKLPESIRSEMRVDRIVDNALKIFIVGQSIPFDGEGVRSGFYPHYATDPLAPTRGSYSTSRNVKLMIADSASKKLKFEVIGRSDGEVRNVQEGENILKSIVPRKSSIVHPARDNLTVVSPIPMGVIGLDQERNDNFWSYVAYEENGRRQAIATFHLMLGSNYRNVYTELWGKPERKNFGLLPAGTHTLTRTTDDLVQVLKGLNEVTKTNDPSQPFLKVINLIQEEPARRPHPPAVREAQHPRKEPEPSVTRKRSPPTLSKERPQVAARKRKPEVSRGRSRSVVKAKAQKVSLKTKPQSAAQKVKTSQRARLKKETPSATKRKVLQTPLKKRPAPATRRKGIRKPLLQKRPRPSHMRRRR